MANKVEIGDWTLANLKNGRLKLKEFEWPKILKLDLYDFGAEYRVAEKIYSGRGTSANYEEAINKAVVECVERQVVFSLCLSTSSGMALHTSKQSAISNAENECLERDQFLCYFYTNTPFKFCKPPDSEFLKKICMITQTKNWVTRFYLLNDSNGLFTTMCAILNDGVYIGLSTSKNSLASFEHSCIEAFRNWVHDIYFNNRVKRALTSMQDLILLPSPETHGEYYSAGANFKKIEHLFTSDRSGFFSTDYPAIKSAVIDLDSLDLNLEIDLYCAHAKGSTVQSLFFGYPKNSVLNFDRLKKFKKADYFNFEQILNEPHPIQ